MEGILRRQGGQQVALDQDNLAFEFGQVMTWTIDILQLQAAVGFLAACAVRLWANAGKYVAEALDSAL